MKLAQMRKIFLQQYRPKAGMQVQTLNKAQQAKPMNALSILS